MSINPGWIAAGALAAPVALELLARLYHRARYLVPFHSKACGEYPYRQFIEKADPPLHFRFKNGFRSSMVNINRFGCRGPEPAPDGQKKRLLAINESSLFGVRLKKETQNWDHLLSQRLEQAYPGRWEVINACNPGYTSGQHLTFWRQELHRVKPDIILISMGGNDMALATVRGQDWRPDDVWPLDFVLALERHSPWYRHYLLNHLCLYFLWRRWRSGPPQPRFKEGRGGVPVDACWQNLKSNITALVEDARAMGAKVAMLCFTVAADLEMSPEDERRAASIQANWRQHMEVRGKQDLKMIDFLKEEVAPSLGIPFIDLRPVFQNHPRRFEMYFDMVHWNHRGMPVVAQTFFETLESWGWWDA